MQVRNVATSLGTHPSIVSPASVMVQQESPVPQSSGVLQSGTVSVVRQLKLMTAGQSAVAVQTAESEPSVQLGRLPPVRTAVAQQVGVSPLQSEGSVQLMVSDPLQLS